MGAGWQRAVAVGVCGGVLSCGILAWPAVAAGDPPAISQAFAGPRPGEAIGIDLLNFTRKPGMDLVAESPVFAAPIRLDAPAEDTGGEGVKAPIPPTAEPGRYPLVVKAHGRVIARDTIDVKPPRLPSVEVDGGRARRPGTKVNVFFDDLYPGETGTSFTVRSTAFPAPVRLAHSKGWNNTRVFNAFDVPLRTTLKDGAYTLRVTDAQGKRRAQARLEVRSAHPGDDDYLGRVQGPAFFREAGRVFDARVRGVTVAAGRTVFVRWQDAYPDPGEEERMTATSPAFQAPAGLRSDPLKGHEQDPPMYWGPARLRTDLEPGSYPVTVVSHRGRVKKTSYLDVTRGPAHHGGERGLPIAVWAGAGTGTLALGAAAAVPLVRRRRRASRS
ncbi:hypothetical protein MUU72_15420 [Streptomyces sp. RS10V-4]|uniref:hypothetical protein n=1 Tax=Streptomyces rhizoryzae TaxID=2932493 RepID=UPI002002AD2F|nr:hypothetical protein [Streptomyces rhizoryzae]MCK7624475.1 hypothetical protein [Streptomyces rhizoryzae]